MLLHELVEKNLYKKSDKIAVFTENEEITYLGLCEKSSQLANWLKRKGVKKGDRVLVYLSNCIFSLLMTMAVSKIGAIFVIVHNETKELTLKSIIDDSQPTILISDEKLCEKCSEQMKQSFYMVGEVWKGIIDSSAEFVVENVIPNDIISIIYTSGSTGRAKGVVSTHNNVIFSANAIQKRLKMVETDVVGCYLPLSFDYGLYQFFLAAQVGATLALSENNTNGTTLLKKIIQWDVTCLPVIPSLANNLLMLLSRKRGKNELNKLRIITNTGAHLPESYIQQLTELIPQCDVFVMFGLTECKRVSILTPDEYKVKPNSVGRPLDETECFVVDEKGMVVENDTVGELVVRGNNVMNGYWRSIDLTYEKFKPWGEGFERALFTGDMFSMDKDGYLYYHGRRDNLFKQNGFRISTSEVEMVALSIDKVEEVVLIPKQDGQGSVMFLKGDIVFDDFMMELRTKLEDYKMPSRVVIVDSFAYTINGKIDSKKMKENYIELFK